MKIGIVGTGNLGNHLSKLICSNMKINTLTISDINPYSASELGKELQKDFNRVWVENNTNNINTSDILFLTVKPNQIKSVCEQINMYSDGDMKTIVSAAAGVPAFKIRNWLRGDHNILRFMPNIPISVGSGSIVWYIHETFEDERKVKEMLSNITLGPESLWISDERLIDMATVAFGCTPAYVAMFYNVYLAIAMELGFSKSDSEKLMKGVFLGSSKLLIESDGHRIIEQVASKGGATEKALEELKQSGIENMIQDSVFSSLKRIENITKSID